MKATVAVDARWIRPGRADGVGRYVASLARELVALEGDERYALVFADSATRDAFLDSTSARTAPATWICPVPLLGGGDVLAFPRWIRGLGADLLHVPHVLTSPFHRPYRTVATLHDLIPWQSRGRERGSRLAWRIFFATRIPLHTILHRVDRLIAVSGATRDELCRDRCVRVPVDVVANGVDLPARQPRPVDHAASGGAILYVGRLDPYKNVDGWLREYAALPEAIRRDHPFVLCGDHDPRFAEPLARQAGELGLGASVEWRGKVSDAELDSLYRQASLLVHPSLDEGFGLTLVEAMARGTPVVAYRLPALVEVAGDAALLVEPAEPGALARGVALVLGSAGERERLVTAGLERAGQLSWRRTAIATRDVYRSVLMARERRP